MKQNLIDLQFSLDKFHKDINSRIPLCDYYKCQKLVHSGRKIDLFRKAVQKVFLINRQKSRKENIFMNLVARLKALEEHDEDTHVILNSSPPSKRNLLTSKMVTQHIQKVQNLKNNTFDLNSNQTVMKNTFSFLLSKKTVLTLLKIKLS